MMCEGDFCCRLVVVVVVVVRRVCVKGCKILVEVEVVVVGKRDCEG